jgi:hypothetical protein
VQKVKTLQEFEGEGRKNDMLHKFNLLLYIEYTLAGMDATRYKRQEWSGERASHMIWWVMCPPKMVRERFTNGSRTRSRTQLPVDEMPSILAATCRKRF